MPEYSKYLSPIETLVDDARNGRMFILVDAEERENEGDLLIPAQMATPEAINFMAKYGRGLICLAMTDTRAKQLQLELMARHNQSRHQTAFTVSIEAREGISTGISAHDRAHTISVAIDTSKSAQDIVSPGHVFPLVAQEGGVLRRAGHTEAAVDIAHIAGLYPAGVICEVMNDDGRMARLPDLVKFAQKHDLKIGTIADLIAYRRRNEVIVERVFETEYQFDTGAMFRAIVYRNKLSGEEHLAMVKGDISAAEPSLVRFHAENMIADMMGVLNGHETILQQSLRLLVKEARGVLVFIRNTSPSPFTDILHQDDAPATTPDSRLREYGVGAQIIADLGVEEIILLSNTTHSVVALEGFGLKIVDQRPISNAG